MRHEMQWQSQHLSILKQLNNLHDAKVILTAVICIAYLHKVSQTKMRDL